MYNIIYCILTNKEKLSGIKSHNQKIHVYIILRIIQINIYFKFIGII